MVDLGSNSVRLVVFEASGGGPVTIFNEKAVLRLGRGLQQTGRLNEEGVAGARAVMARYGAVARAMEADPFEVLATAAVRDASNGPAFVQSLQSVLPGVPIRVLAGEEEAALSADGVLGGIPDADGILADIGGGSLEVLALAGGKRGSGRTLRLGVIRLSDRAEGDLARARAIADEDIGGQTWLSAGAGRSLYLVGGAFRAIARIQIARTGYPLHIVHHYVAEAEAVRQLAGELSEAGRRVLEKLPGAPRRRVEDLPFAAIALRRLLRATGARRVVWSANGIREGWFNRLFPLPDEPILAGARDLAVRYGRDPALPPALIDWTAPLFDAETAAAARLRACACWLSDIGSHDHPDYRAEQAFLRVLRQPGLALDHPARAFLATTLALRYEAEPDAAFLLPVRVLLDAAAQRRAVQLGLALRLAYTLSAGTVDLLAATAILVEGGRVTLRITEGSGVFGGESVVRRLERLAAALKGDGRGGPPAVVTVPGASRLSTRAG